MIVDNNKRFLNRLKNFYYSLYEVESELSLINKSKKTIISGSEYDYIQSLEMRKKELETNIEELFEL